MSANTKTNPYTPRLKERGLNKFQREQLKQRERGWNDYHAGKDILSYYEEPMERSREVGRANYNFGWRAALDIDRKAAK